MRVLLDTNIILDFLLQRDPFFQGAAALFQEISSDRVVGYIAATTLTDIFYIARKQSRSIEQARQAVSKVLVAVEICPVDRDILESAFTSEQPDFEDAIQIACATAQGLEAIVTRDIQGFLRSIVPVLSVQQLLKQLA